MCKILYGLGLAGGSASGKTTVARRIIESLGVPWVSLLSMDSFYKVPPLSLSLSLSFMTYRSVMCDTLSFNLETLQALTPEQNKKAAENEYNFDRPGKSTVYYVTEESYGLHLFCVCVSADAFDMDLLVDTLQKLKEGKHVEIPIYDFSTHAHAKYKVLYQQ